MAGTDFTPAARLRSEVPSLAFRGAAAHRFNAAELVRRFGAFAKLTIDSDNSDFVYDGRTWERFDSLLSELEELFSDGLLETAAGHLLASSAN